MLLACGRGVLSPSPAIPESELIAPKWVPIPSGWKLTSRRPGRVGGRLLHLDPDLMNIRSELPTVLPEEREAERFKTLTEDHGGTSRSHVDCSNP